MLSSFASFDDELRFRAENRAPDFSKTRSLEPVGVLQVTGQRVPCGLKVVFKSEELRTDED